MALSYTVTYPELAGRRRVVNGTITFDNSYPTGGEPVTVASLGLLALDTLQCYPASGYVPAWDRSVSAPKILVYMGDNDGVADGPGVQVANTTDLSALVIQFRAVGI